MPKAKLTAELIGPKMHRPSLSPDYLPRERLLHELDVQRNCPLVLVTGPAGYGKTTLLSAWLELLDWPAMWISLDAGDNDLRVFVQYVVAAIQRRFPDALQKTAALLKSITLPGEAVLAGALINDLDQIETPCVLALDDYHVIQDKAIHGLIASILRHPPHCFHLAIASRYDPMLPLSTMRAKGNVAEIRLEDLRFNIVESAELLQRLVGNSLPAAIVSSVAEQVDGWVAGLRVAALSLRHNPNALSDKPHGAPASSDLMAYLFDEVLMQQPAVIQNFLIRTSILDTLTPALCGAVAGKENTLYNRESCLDYAARNGLFINPVDASEKVYRYHRLFQMLLQKELIARCGKAEVAALHRLASEWHVQQGQPDEALQHAILARDYRLAASIFSQFRPPLMNNDEWLRLEFWLAQFPREIIESSADLLIIEAYIAYMRFRREECVNAVQRIEALLDAMPPSPDKDVLHGEVAGFLAHHHILETGDMVKCEEYAQIAVKLAPADRWFARVMGWTGLCSIPLFKGDFVSALELLQHSLQDARTQGDGFKVCLLAMLGFIHAYAGDLSGQLRVANEVLKYDDSAGQAGLPSRWVTYLNWARYHKGVAHYQRNELAEAEASLAVIVAQRYQSHVHCVVQSMFVLALTYQAQGRPDDARKLANQAAEYALEQRCTTLIPVTELFQAQLAVQQSRIAEAVYLLGNREMPALFLPAMFFFVGFLTAAKVLLAEGSETSQARVEAMIKRLQDYVAQLHNPRVQMEALMLEALLADTRRDIRTALTKLECALALAQPEGYVRIFADHGPRMAGLLSRLHSPHVSPAFIQRILDAIKQPATKTPPQSMLLEPLTDRELQVLALLQKRMSDKEIAALLFISPGTVKRHTHTIFQKLDVHSRREAVLKGENLKLIALA